jgi:integrase/recombinase XerD
MNTLRQDIHGYIDMRRDLGFKLRAAGPALLDFATFMEQQHEPYITQALALIWSQKPANAQPAYWAQRLGYVRGFARYRSASDPRNQIPAQGLLPFRPKRARPYLYSDEEIKNLLNAAVNMSHRCKNCALLPWVYYCLFGLLCVSGLRLGEARNLMLRMLTLRWEC